MKKFLVIVFLSLFSFFSFAAEKISHPQLMFTTNDIPQIKKNLEHTECKYAVLEMNSLLSSYFGLPGNPAYLKDGKNKWDQRMLCAIESAAFKYA